MSRVEGIKTQIDALSWQERCELNALVQNWPTDSWEEQMTADGKLDLLNESALEEYRAGRCRP